MKFSLILTVLSLIGTQSLSAESKTLLNVSYDVSREYYKDINEAFLKSKKDTSSLTIDQSHAGSSKQARAVIDGLQADVVTMNQETDIDAIAKEGLIDPGWKARLPDGSSPYISTIVFLVRKGNPKGIASWNDLVKPGTSVIIPNPKTSGNGRYSYLAAWAFAQEQGEKPQDFVKALFSNVPILESGGRAATNTFVQKGIGDVLLTFESEVFQIQNAFDSNSFEIIYPSESILAEFPVSVVDTVVDKNKSRALAEDYLAFLWTKPAQEIAAKHFLRPRDSGVLAASGDRFPSIRLLSVDETLGGWANAQKTHFVDGGTFDQIYAR